MLYFVLSAQASTADGAKTPHVPATDMDHSGGDDNSLGELVHEEDWVRGSFARLWPARMTTMAHRVAGSASSSRIPPAKRARADRRGWICELRNMGNIRQDSASGEPPPGLERSGETQASVNPARQTREISGACRGQPRCAPCLVQEC